jgi:hypothetical protein
LNTLGVEPVSYMGSLRWIRHEPRIARISCSAALAGVNYVRLS